ncbi:hypothetical protein M5X00_23015 [Paenibacillus alvei]|uniref:hypothetical protein n=1 Tax=Paenibacillus alvei TaxID=44250 RepID=UPI00028A3F40|nr:hypothetical protein [Paenibacillus alvei]EJW19964.1 hypothetical protein PAV_1c09530 [Paenibacillus alvei DSM 29]MCY9540451.1 hypothetical protein [Paenibacillus alvei]MCY9705550.1 hypothetical protein [Paenibacillus alvei]MCY9738024.1 hypothetical protein [Paenibacillus alvei]MCY9757118.1 hypothetical protein [Paenibacillus alvei]
MYIKSLEDFEEYEPYCSVCHKDLNDVWELVLEGHCRGEIWFCIDCRRGLLQLLQQSTLVNQGVIHV